MSIYQDIAARTGGDVYIGVVGPVRTGKSTLIKKFMEEVVVPNIENTDARARALDEMPQSASGKTVMTTEPKFVPDNAVEISLDNNSHFKVKLIDCVGYVVDGAEGLLEDGEPRMVMTPWSKEPIPFERAAELGTKKVIEEHSTIGLMVTSDGSIGDIQRHSYEEAERRVISELKANGKPFVIILNSATPESASTIELAFELEKKYQTPVALVNCLELDEKDIRHILELVLFEFPTVEIEVCPPKWLCGLDDNHTLKKSFLEKLEGVVKRIKKIGDIKSSFDGLSGDSGIENISLEKTDLGCGKTLVNVKFSDEAYYDILSECAGVDIRSEEKLLEVVRELGQVKGKYDRVFKAIRDVEEKGYGIVVPDIADMELEEPEIIKQSGGYGVKLRASADSIHMIKTRINTEISPIVGSEKQSEDMVKFLLDEFRENPTNLWQSNMFGKSLHELVNEGLSTKLENMPEDSREKLAQALQKIINEGSRGLICVIL